MWKDCIPGSVLFCVIKRRLAGRYFYYVAMLFQSTLLIRRTFSYLGFAKSDGFNILSSPTRKQTIIGRHVGLH